MEFCWCWKAHLPFACFEGILEVCEVSFIPLFLWHISSSRGNCGVCEMYRDFMTWSAVIMRLSIMFLLWCKKKISLGHDEYTASVPVFICMGAHVFCFFLYFSIGGCDKITMHHVPLSCYCCNAVRQILLAVLYSHSTQAYTVKRWRCAKCLSAHITGESEKRRLHSADEAEREMSQVNKMHASTEGSKSA